MLRQKLYIGLFAAIAIAVFYGCGGGNKEIDNNIVARVDGDALLADDVFIHIPPEFSQHLDREQLLRIIDDWVDEQLLTRYAIDNGAQKDAEVERKLEDAKNQIFVDFLRNRIIAQRIKVSRQDVERYYVSHQSDFVRDRSEVHALHIKVGSKALADSVKKILAVDTSFCAAAQRYSTEYYDKDSCDLGWFSKSDIVPKLVRPVFSAKPDDVVGPIKIGEEYHFFKIIERENNGTVRSLEQVKDEIFGKLYSMRFNEVFSNLLDSLRSAAMIEIDTAAIDSITFIRK